MPVGHTTQLLERLRQGNPEARHEIIAHACERLRKLTRKMLRSYVRVRRWAETDDVLQNALLRLHRSLAEVKPESARQFYSLAATQIRRELIDLARHYLGVRGMGTKHDTDGGKAAEAKPDEGNKPETVEAWYTFHEMVEQLPEEQREVVSLIWYEGLPQPEVAIVLGISLATVKRRWQEARLALRQNLDQQDFE